jgi:uncharacterized protein YecE (DUF72 family)
LNAERSGKVYLGTQGFSFDDWVGPFYPAGTSKTAYLEQYAERLPAVEIDSTFYGVPRAATVQKWRERTPPGFRFAAKFPKLITHLDVFLAALPRGTRYAVEVRNRGWLKPEFREMLSQHNVALVLQDLHYMPRLDWITADFTVIRWLGRRKDIARFDEIQIDRSQELGEWAQKVSRFLADGVNVYGFFNNHFAGHSPESVRQFAALLGVDLMENTKESNRGAQMAMEFDDE